MLTPIYIFIFLFFSIFLTRVDKFGGTYHCLPRQKDTLLIDSSLLKLGVRSLVNASRARQFNPLNPPGVGWVPLPQTNMAVVVGRACAVVRGRSCVVVRGRAWSCAVGRAWSCAVVRGRACVVGHSWSCAVGRAWSCAAGCGLAVLPASRPALP